MYWKGDYMHGLSNGERNINIDKEQELCSHSKHGYQGYIQHSVEEERVYCEFVYFVFGTLELMNAPWARN